MATIAFVIAVDGIDNTQRTLMHSWIKSQTEEWWHQLPDVWVVVGRTAKFWRDGLQPFTLPTTQILVMGLKGTPGERWATHRVSNSDWFKGHLPPIIEPME